MIFVKIIMRADEGLFKKIIVCFMNILAVRPVALRPLYAYIGISAGF